MIPQASFVNYLMSWCQHSELFYQKDIFETIARDFDDQQNNNINLMKFSAKLQFESEKQALLEQFYWKLKESMDFRGTRNLYDLLQQFDNQRDKKFYTQELEKVLISKGMVADQITLNFFFDEYDSRQGKYVEYTEIEKDYFEFEEFFHRSRPQAMQRFTLHDLLYMIRNFCESQQRTLREQFKKTKVGQRDTISKFDFTKIMTEISYQNIDSDSIDRFAEELDPEGKHEISFSELLKKYNEMFNIEDDAFDQIHAQQSNKTLLNHIAQILYTNKRFVVQTHFQFPQSSLGQFV